MARPGHPGRQRPLPRSPDSTSTSPTSASASPPTSATGAAARSWTGSTTSSSPRGKTRPGWTPTGPGRWTSPASQPRLLPAVEADPVLGAELLRYPFASTTTLAFNLTKAPFQDKQVREAFAYAFDREAYCREIAHGTCAPTLSWIPPGVPGHIDTDAYAFDPEAGAAGAGRHPPTAGRSSCPRSSGTTSRSTPTPRTEAEWLAEQYREVLGVELTLTPIAGDDLGAMFNVDAAT